MKAFSTVIKYISVITFMLVLALTFIAVCCRYILNNSIIWAEEVIRYSSIWVFFLTMCESTRVGGHLALDIVPGAVHGKAKSVLNILIEIISLVFDIVLIRYGAELAVINMSQSSPALHIPYGCIYAAIPVGAALMGIFGIQRILKFAKELKEGGASV